MPLSTFRSAKTSVNILDTVFVEAFFCTIFLQAVLFGEVASLCFYPILMYSCWRFVLFLFKMAKRREREITPT